MSESNKEQTEIQLTEEKSTEQAGMIQTIGILVQNLDIKYLEKLHEALLKQASRQDALSVLNPRYTSVKRDLFFAKIKNLSHLIAYAQTVEEIKKLALIVNKDDLHKEEIDKFFMS